MLNGSGIMVEVILIILVGIGSLTGGIFIGKSLSPDIYNSTQTMEVHNAYQVDTVQRTTTEVFQGQITITAIDTKGILTNINFNVKDYTNLSVSSSTNSNLISSVTNTKSWTN
jgi:hypothetical protein